MLSIGRISRIAGGHEKAPVMDAFGGPIHSNKYTFVFSGGFGELAITCSVLLMIHPNRYKFLNTN